MQALEICCTLCFAPVTQGVMSSTPDPMHTVSVQHAEEAKIASPQCFAAWLGH